MRLCLKKIILKKSAITFAQDGTSEAFNSAGIEGDIKGNPVPPPGK